LGTIDAMVAQAMQQAGGRKRSFRLRPIGYVRTSYCHPEETPAQAPLNPDERGLLVIYPRYAPALAGVADAASAAAPRSAESQRVMTTLPSLVRC
jgi:hypothetical protein